MVDVELNFDVNAKPAVDGLDELGETAKQVEKDVVDLAVETENATKAFDAWAESQGYANDALNKTSTGTKEAAINFKQLTAIFGTLTAATAVLAVAHDNVAQKERQTAQAAVTYGITSRQMYEDINRELVNATDGYDEMGKTIEYLSKQQMPYNDQLFETAKLMDQLGDSLKIPANEAASYLIPTMRALNIEMSQMPEYVDAIAYASKTTNFQFQDWAYVMRFYGEGLQKLGVDPKETIAISAALEAKGKNIRAQRQIFNSLIQQGAKGEKDILEAQKEQVKIQEKLNTLKEDSLANQRDYLEEMRFAGGDVAKMRQLTMQHNKALRDEQKKRADLEKEMSDQQAIVAKGAPKIDAIALLEKSYPGITKTIEDIKAKSTGAAAEYGATQDIATAGETVAYEVDQSMQLVGKNVTDAQAKSLLELTKVSAALTTISGIAAIIQGFSATTAIATTITAGQGAGAAGGAGLMKGILGMSAGAAATGIIGGAALGALGIYAMEQTGVTSLGADLAGNKDYNKAGMIERAGYDTREALLNSMKGTGGSTDEYAGQPGAGEDVFNAPNAIGTQDNSIQVGTINIARNEPLDQIASALDRARKFMNMQQGVRTAGLY